MSRSAANLFLAGALVATLNGQGQPPPANQPPAPSRALPQVTQEFISVDAPVVVLQHVRVIDGTGAPWFRADVGVRGDTIAAVGDLSRARARTRIALKDQAIAPGFIDMLGQSELNALVDPRQESKVRQGITTELTGEGVSPAPMNAKWIHENEPWLRKYKLKVDWTDLSGYFRRLRRARPSINEALLVGAGQVRGVVLGFKDVEPDEAQLAQMQSNMIRDFDVMERDQQGYSTTNGLFAIIGTLGRLPGRKSLVLF